MPPMADGDGSVYRAPIGTRDVLPPESDRWVAVVSAFAARAARFGYGLVVTPVFEHYEVFQRVGASTDVVRKEMYDFTDKGGRHVALRPEGTAPVVRAYVQHRPDAAVEGLVRGAELPLRATAEGPVPPALAARRRGARRRRPRRRRRGHRARPRLLPRPRPEAGHAAAELDGRLAVASPLPRRRCPSTCSTTPPPWAPTSASASSRTRCASSIRSATTGRT